MTESDSQEDVFAIHQPNGEEAYQDNSQSIKGLVPVGIVPLRGLGNQNLLFSIHEVPVTLVACLDP
jgi:hypothetical protein